MGYFRELPDLEYQSPLNTRISSDEYLRVKNLFRRVKLRDDLKYAITLYRKYQIPDNFRPDLVAEDVYGRADYDWIILITAGIINIKDQWPLSNYHIYRYAEEKYGEYLNDVHHYQTTEVKDSRGRIILPAGKVVDSTYTIRNPNDPTAILNPVTSVTNYEYEVQENEKKRSITVLKREYLQQFLNDFRSIMVYDQSSQYVNNTLLRTENTRNTSP